MCCGAPILKFRRCPPGSVAGEHGLLPHEPAEPRIGVILRRADGQPCLLIRGGRIPLSANDLNLIADAPILGARRFFVGVDGGAGDFERSADGSETGKRSSRNSHRARFLTRSL